MKFREKKKRKKKKKEVIRLILPVIFIFNTLVELLSVFFREISKKTNYASS